MDAANDLVPFPLFHGTSGHYLSASRPGTTPIAWPHKDVALTLLRNTWTVLSKRRYELTQDTRENLGWDVNYEEIPWFVKNVMQQASRHANWQHGELYLTPSKLTAVNYACGGAKYGGELLTFCKSAIDALATIDHKAAEDLAQGADTICTLLQGTEHPPILVEFDNVKMIDLSGETGDKDTRETLAFLSNADTIQKWGGQERVLEIFGQQANFRLASGCAIVKRVFEVHMEDIDHYQPLVPFDLTEIPRAR